MPKHSHSRSVTNKRRTLAKGGRSFLSVLMSIVLVVGLCPSLAYAGEPANSRALAPTSAALTPAASPNSLTFTPAEPYETLENTYYTIEKGSDGIEYHQYYFTGFNEGDQITITDREGAETSYTYSYSDQDECWYFRNGEEKLVDSDGIVPECYSLQNSPVEAGSAVTFEIRYNGLSARFDVPIIKDPVKSIELIPAGGRDLSLLEEAGGEWGDDGHYRYRFPDFQEGDSIVAKNEDGETVYEYSWSNYAWTSSDREDSLSLTGSWVGQPSESDPNHVSFTFNYEDPVYYNAHREFEVSLAITPNPVESVAFTAADDHPLTLIEGTGGMDAPYLDENGAEKSYYRYIFPYFIDGDTIVVTGDPDYAGTYAYGFDGDGNSGFGSIDGRFIRYGNELSDVRQLDSDQDGAVEPGATITFTFSYMGREFKVPMQIVADPVASIEFVKADNHDLTVIKEANGHWGGDDGDVFMYSFPGFQEGDSIVVTNTDDSKTVYTCGYADDDSIDLAFRDPDGVELTIDGNWEGLPDSDSGNAIFNFSYWEPGYRSVNREFVVSVPIAANPVTSVNFTPAEGHEFSLVEGTGGMEDYYWDENGNGNTYYRYNFPGFEEGDSIKIEGGVDYAGTYLYSYGDDGDLAFRSEQLGRAIYYRDWSDDGIVNSSSDQTGPITAPDTITFTFSYMGREFEVPVAITENPVESVEFVPADGVDLTVVEGKNGWEQLIRDDEDNKIGSYFEYSFPGFRDGDRVSVKGSEDVEGTYSYIGFGYGASWLFSNGDKTIEIEGGDSDQNADVSAGSEEPIKFTFSYMGCAFEVPVKVIENPVKSITFAPANGEEITVVEGMNGYEANEWIDDEIITFYRYFFPGFRTGDSLVVEGSSGEKVTYVYSFDRWGEGAFRNDDDALELSEDRSDQVGDVTSGATITFPFSYEGRLFTVPVKVIENPVTAIAFTPKSRYEVEENITSDMFDQDGAVFWYSFSGFNEGDVLTVYRGETPTDYTCQYVSDEDGYEGRAFVSAAGETIDVSAYLDQDDSNPWILEEGQSERTYQEGVIIECGGRSCRAPITLIQNTVKEIRFEPAGEGHSVIENAYGWWCTDDDGEGQPESYFMYYPPFFTQGDKLTVVYSGDGSEKVFEYDESSESFIAVDSEGAIGAYSGNAGYWGWSNYVNSVVVESLQDGPIEGDTLTARVNYHARSFDYDVKIISNDVERIEFVHAGDPYTVISEMDGSWEYDDDGNKYFWYNLPVFEGGDILRVWTNGSDQPVDYEYSYDRRAFVNGDKSINANLVELSSEQDTTHWVEGNTYDMALSCFGKECSVPVTVQQNPVKSISFTPACGEYTVDEGTNGRITTDYNGEFYWYYAPRFSEGDKLVVTFADDVDNPVTFEYKYLEDDEDPAFVSESGKKIDPDLVDRECVSGEDMADQLDKHWEPGGIYAIATTYMNRTCLNAIKVIPETNALVDLSGATVILPSTSFVYNGQEHKPVPTGVKLGDGTVVSGGYTVSYAANKNAGTATVTVTGDGVECVGEAKAEFKISQARATVAARDASKVFGNQDPALSASVTGLVGSDKIVYSIARVAGESAGEYAINATGAASQGNYSVTYKGAKFTVTPKPVKPTVSLGKKSVAYTGKTPKLSLTVAIGSKKLAASGYTVSYASDGKNVGAHKVTVSLTGNYSGSATAAYTIVPKAASITKLQAAKKGFTVKWKKSAQASGYEVMYSTNKKFKSGSKTVSVKGGKVTSKKVTKLKAKKKYYVKMRAFKTVGKKKYYSAWSAVSQVKTKK